MAKLNANEKPITFTSTFGVGAAQQEMMLYVLVSALDVFMTYILLRRGDQFVESNPVARYVLSVWDIRGMVYFKFALVAFVCVLAQIIAHRRPLVARWILLGATGLVSIVVVYSLLLLLKHGNADVTEISRFQHHFVGIADDQC